jgi:hypothetical protein
MFRLVSGLKSPTEPAACVRRRSGRDPHMTTDRMARTAAKTRRVGETGRGIVSVCARDHRVSQRLRTLTMQLLIQARL